MGARAERRSYYTPAARLALVEDDLDQHDTELGDHETRLRGLERITAKVIGAATVGGVVSGALTAMIAQAVVG